MSRLAHVRRLAAIDVRRMVRKHTERNRGVGSLVSTAMFVLLFAVTTLAGGYGAKLAGEALVAGSLSDITANGIVQARGLVAVLGLILTVVIAVRAFGQRGTLTNAEGVLSIVPTREALVSVLVAESAYVLLWLAGPILGASVGLAVGTGTVWPVLSIPLAVGMIGVTGVAVGYPLGLGLRHVVTRFAFVARNKGALIVLAFVLYFAFVVSGSLNATIGALFEPLQTSPTGWFADLLFLGVPVVDVSPLRAAGAVGVLAVLGVLSVVAGTRFANAHWFSDPAVAGDSEPEPVEERSEPAIERRLEPYVGLPTATLVALAWRRSIRAPIKLLYAAYPLFFAIGGIADIVQTGEVPSSLPVATLIFVTWAAGVIFTLNPLGDQGAGLPTALLSRVDGKRFVRAHLLASLLVALPVGITLTAAAALASPVETTTAVAVVLAAPVLMVVSSALSIGIGIAFPRFEAISIARSLKTVIPSTLAFILFSAHLLATTLSAVLVYDRPARSATAALLSWVLPFGLSVDAGTVYIASGMVLVALALAPIASYRYAVRRFDTYTVS